MMYDNGLVWRGHLLLRRAVDRVSSPVADDSLVLAGWLTVDKFGQGKMMSQEPSGEVIQGLSLMCLHFFLSSWLLHIYRRADVNQHSLEHGEEKISTDPPEGLKCAGLSMRGNFEFPGSLGKKRRTDKSYSSCYLGKEANWFLGRNKASYHSCQIYFFTFDLTEKRNWIFHGTYNKMSNC